MLLMLLHYLISLLSKTKSFWFFHLYSFIFYLIILLSPTFFLFSVPISTFIFLPFVITHQKNIIFRIFFSTLFYPYVLIYILIFKFFILSLQNFASLMRITFYLRFMYELSDLHFIFFIQLNEHSCFQKWNSLQTWWAIFI